MRKQSATTNEMWPTLNPMENLLPYGITAFSLFIIYFVLLDGKLVDLVWACSKWIWFYKFSHFKRFSVNLKK